MEEESRRTEKLFHVTRASDAFRNVVPNLQWEDGMKEGEKAIQRVKIITPCFRQGIIIWNDQSKQINPNANLTWSWVMAVVIKYTVPKKRLWRPSHGCLTDLKLNSRYNLKTIHQQIRNSDSESKNYMKSS